MTGAPEGLEGPPRPEMDWLISSTTVEIVQIA